MTRLEPLMRRLRFSLAIVALAAAGVVAVVAAPAEALKTQTFEIRQGADTEKTYGPIPGNYPATTAAVPTPSGCGNDTNTAPFETQCDTVPIKIHTPKLAGNEDFIVTLTVTWEPKEDVDGTYVNDLDIYLYDNQQIGKRTNPESTSYTRLGYSAGAVQPERVKMFSPDLGDYNLVVINWSGPNVSYTLHATMSVEGFDSPFEDLGPRFGGRSTTSDESAPADLSGIDDEASGPIDYSAFDEPAAAESGALANLPEVAVLPDADFEGFGASTFDRELTADTAELGAPRSRTGAAAPGPVSVPLLLFWLVVVPLAVVGVLFVSVLRRSRSSFAFAHA